MNVLRERYIKFCKLEKSIPIFSQPWWLDAVCGEKNWEVILIEKGNQIVGSFPIYKNKAKIFTHLEMPILTQKLGPYIKYPKGQNSASRLSYEKEIIQEMIDRLPKFDSLTIHLDYKYTNWLPFYWKSFTQTTRYTYLIDDLSDNDIVFKSFSGNKKTDIRKASKKILIKYDLECENFVRFYSQSLSKMNDSLNYSEDILRKLCHSAHEHQQGKIIYAVNAEDPLQIYGAIFFVWDNESIYNLVTAFDPDYRNTAASTYMFYQIMKDFRTSGLRFDFEGSMIESIERSYNKFGTKQMPYFKISKIGSRRYKIYNLLIDLKNVVKN